MLSEKQKKILAFQYSRYDSLICDGAVRSGKTSLMMVAFVDWAMREFSGSVALRNSKPVFQLGLSISQPKSKRLPQDPNRILPCVSVFYEPYVMFQCLQLIFVRFYRF